MTVAADKTDVYCCLQFRLSGTGDGVRAFLGGGRDTKAKPTQAGCDLAASKSVSGA